jgi:hypothetical protein
LHPAANRRTSGSSAPPPGARYPTGAARAERPSQREIAELRRGGSLSIAAYLLGFLQKVLVNVENAASDLRAGADEKMLSRVDKLRPCVIEINAISAALDEPMDVERGG